MFDFFKKGLAKTLENIVGVKGENKKITKDLLEEISLEADMAYEIVEEIVYYLSSNDEVKKEDLKRVMDSYFLCENKESLDEKPSVELILGVNGTGKTTSIAKLASLYKNQGQRVILGACDTFRVGVIKQLRLWSEKVGVDIVLTQQGHDPSAVAFDIISKARAKGLDKVIIDTTGRLQNQRNLANELEKIVRISAKVMPHAPHKKILVLDDTQGNVGISQAKAFNELVQFDGVIITKPDGTAKGGALFSIARELELSILYIGVGEKIQDSIEFNAQNFLDTLLEDVFD